MKIRNLLDSNKFNYKPCDGLIDEHTKSKSLKLSDIKII